LLSLLDNGNIGAASEATFIDAHSNHKVLKIQQVPSAQETNCLDPGSDVKFYPDIKPELKIEIPSGDCSFEDVIANPAAAAVSENILDKLLLSAGINTANVDGGSHINGAVINTDPEEAQDDWEESLNELFPDLV